MTFEAHPPGLATIVLKLTRRTVDSPFVAKLLPLTALLLVGCISRPGMPSTMTVVSMPAGAICTTTDGEVVTLPAEIPCDSDGVTRINVAMIGYAPREVDLVSGSAKPRLGSLILADLFGGVLGVEQEQLLIVDGVAVLELDVLPETDPAKD